jgi:hypothetical protein
MPRLRLVPLLLLPALGTALGAQGAPPPLSFLGFQAGSRLESVDQQLRALGSRGLHCDRSRLDARVQECRAVLADPATTQPLALWLSAIDSSAGIMTVSGAVTGVDIDRWKRHLETRFGVVDGRVQGGQWMLQWVRRGRMLRLTWKIEQGAKVASVSLVDGTLLDGWGRARVGSQSAEAVPMEGAVTP